MLQAHASPTLPGATLRHHLWNAVRGAVLTSATLTSCGRFDFFLKETGLFGDPAVVALEVPSPFDFARQGRLVLVDELPDPKDANAYNQAMVRALLRDLKKSSMARWCCSPRARSSSWPRSRCPPTCATRCWCRPAAALPAARAPPRARRGRAAVGHLRHAVLRRGLDLPDPALRGPVHHQTAVRAARRSGRRGARRVAAPGRPRPVVELVVPATAIRLAQWVDRAIRTEEDEAHATCYDRRLSATSYGQRLLQGLPPFTRITACG